MAKNNSVSLEITGYLDIHEYLSNLKESALAIQLRSIDSGEASGVISDLLFFGVPTIINEIGSFTSIPNTAAVKLPKEPSIEDIADGIHQALNEKVRRDLSVNAQNFSSINSSPESWTKQLITFMNRRYDLDLIHNGRRYSKVIHKNDILRFSNICKSMQKKDNSFGHRFLVSSDVTTLKNTKFLSGIQRATLEIHKALRSSLTPDRFLLGQIDFGLGELEENTMHSQIRDDVIISGSLFDSQQIDALLLIDLNFTYFHSDKFSKIVKRNIPIITNVYDVLPISNPEWFPEGTAENLFIPWIDSVLRYSSDLILNSNATLNELTKIKQFSSFKGDVHVAPLGIPKDFRRAQAERIQHRTLLVGTIEPRKGHADALNAFDQLHARGVLVELHIVGRQGWMVESIIRRIINHTLFNKKLFWHNDCSDEELNNLYESSQITLVTSQGEGFGLHLIEALSQGSQVIARDIPVFREIGQEGVIFFDINASNLVDVWMNALHNTKETKSESISQNYGYGDYAQAIRSIIEQRLK